MPLAASCCMHVDHHGWLAAIDTLPGTDTVIVGDQRNDIWGVDLLVDEGPDSAPMVSLDLAGARNNM